MFVIPMKKIDFTQLTNSELNIKLKGFENEYDVKKNKILQLIGELKELDEIYITAKNELNSRSILD